MRDTVEAMILDLDKQLAAGHHLDDESICKFETLLLKTWYVETSLAKAFREKPSRRAAEWLHLYDQLQLTRDVWSAETLIRFVASLGRRPKTRIARK